MADIDIEWLSDTYGGCETCGTSWAEGAIVKIDGAVALELRPVAHCFGGDNFPVDEVYERILKHLGHALTGVRCHHRKAGNLNVDSCQIQSGVRPDAIFRTVQESGGGQ